LTQATATGTSSLELMRGLDFDVIVPSVSAAGQPFYDLVDRE
jgi:hypothetical protein